MTKAADENPHIFLPVNFRHPATVMTDTHAHLDWLEASELAAALASAAHFRAILTIGTNNQRNPKALEIAEQNSNVWAAVGLHPTDATELDQAREPLIEWLKHPKVRAIGETGLDYHWTPQTKAEQLKALDFQAGLAAQQGLPLIFHVRSAQGDDSAEQDLAQWLQQNRPTKYILHAFGAHPKLIEVGLEQGAYFSFAGPLTYKKNRALRDAAKELPISRILLETDTPFLPPEPHRGKPNQPALVRYTLEKLAEVLGISPADLEAQTDQNAQELLAFGP
jgi:TatD DNase family protein